MQGYELVDVLPHEHSQILLCMCCICYTYIKYFLRNRTFGTSDLCSIIPSSEVFSLSLISKWHSPSLPFDCIFFFCPDHLSTLFTVSPTRMQTTEKQQLFLFCSLLHSHDLEKYLAQCAPEKICYRVNICTSPVYTDS